MSWREFSRVFWPGLASAVVALATAAAWFGVAYAVLRWHGVRHPDTLMTGVLTFSVPWALIAAAFSARIAGRRVSRWFDPIE